MTEDEWKDKIISEFSKLTDEQQKTTVLEIVQQYGAEVISHARQIKHLLTVIETVVKTCKNSEISEVKIAEAITMLDKSMDALIYSAKDNSK